MAITILPYPSMDFTPLDVLTADELDQFVANINAINNTTMQTANIADGAITTAKVADEAITAGKIKWDSLSSGSPVSMGFTASGGTYTAPHFGYCVVECAVQNNAKVSISVNGTETLTAQGGATAFEWIPVVVPVCKGDVIVATSSDSGTNAQVMTGSTVFIPFTA